MVPVKRGGEKGAAQAPRPGFSIADSLSETQVAEIVRRALAPDVDATPKGKRQYVVWDDADSQALVHLDSVSVKILNRFIVISANFETEQTGVAPLIVTFALGTSGDNAGLVAVADENARGHLLLASRWGAIFRETLWAALLATARIHAGERGLMPAALYALDGHLRLHAEKPVSLASVARDAVKGLSQKNLRS